MLCPYCTAATTTPMARRMTLGYRMFRCRACRRTSNERTDTLYNHLHVPTDIAVLVVLWRLQYKLGPRTRFNEAVSLAEQRRLFQEHWGDVCTLLQTA